MQGEIMDVRGRWGLTIFLSIGMYLFSQSLLCTSPFADESLSDDFIIRWDFQNCCKFVYDATTKWEQFPTNQDHVTTFNPAEVEAGDVIFVRGHKKFFEELVPGIKHPFIVVTHGQSPDSFKENYFPYLENPKVIAWFTVHPCTKQHPKLIPIPLGIKQRKIYYEGRHDLNEFMKKLRAIDKPHWLYLNVGEWSHRERAQIVDFLKSQPFCYYGEKVAFHDYLSAMAICKFTVAPRGVGIDTYRCWESLLVGSIPIVISSQLNELYDKLPVVIVKDWAEITQEFLEKKYAEIMSKKESIQKLYMTYWRDRIAAVRNAFFVRN